MQCTNIFKSKRQKMDDVDCPICFEALGLERNIIECNNNLDIINIDNDGCKHHFHKKCIFEWQKKNCEEHNYLRCPLCRKYNTFMYLYSNTSEWYCASELLFYEDIAIYGIAFLNWDVDRFKLFREDHLIDLDYHNISKNVYSTETIACARNIGSFVHAAIHSKNEQLLRYLIDMDADIHLLDYRRNTTLLAATKNEFLQARELLLYAGVDLDICDMYGENVLSVAVNQDDVDFITTLCTKFNVTCKISMKKVANSLPSIYIMILKHMENNVANMKMKINNRKKRKHSFMNSKILIEDIIKLKKMQTDIETSVSESLSELCASGKYEVIDYLIPRYKHLFNKNHLCCAIRTQHTRVVFKLINLGIDFTCYFGHCLLPDNFDMMVHRFGVNPYFTAEYNINLSMNTTKKIFSKYNLDDFECCDEHEYVKLKNSPLVKLTTLGVMLLAYKTLPSEFDKQCGFCLYDQIGEKTFCLFNHYEKGLKKTAQQHVLDYLIKPVLAVARMRNIQMCRFLKIAIKSKNLMLTKMLMCEFKVKFIDDVVKDTVLHTATFLKQYEILEYLLTSHRNEAKKCINYQNIDSKTPLMIAVSGNRTKAMRIILNQAGFDIKLDLVDKNGNTALQTAIYSGQRMCVQFLRKHYSDVELSILHKNTSGKNAEQLAKEHKIEKYFYVK
jgi:ankyrin repeat protein